MHRWTTEIRAEGPHEAGHDVSGRDQHPCSPEGCRCASKENTSEQRDEREALGRSRGGFGTKACVITDAIGQAVAFVLAPGQDHELPHDIVEIDAGDAPIHVVGQDKAALEQAERQAAERIFGLLPSQQGRELLALWHEFEEAATPAARFAKALDRLQPLLLNTLTDGGTWTENGVTEQQVMDRYGPTIEAGSPLLWQEASRLVRQHFAGQLAA